MKNRIWDFILRNKNILLAIIIILIGAGLAYGILSGKGIEETENPNEGFYEDASKVYVTGEKYTLNEKQEQEFIEEQQKEEKEENPDEKREQAILENVQTVVGGSESKGEESVQGDNTGGSPGIGGEEDEIIQEGFDDGETGEGDSEGNVSPEDQGDPSKKPLIICSLDRNSEFDGKYVHFNVKAEDYNGNPITSFGIEVKINGKLIYAAGQEDGYVYKEKENIFNGTNEVAIKVKDKEGNVAEKNYIVVVNTEAERTEGGKCTIWIEAKSVGLGELARDNSMTFYEGENVAEVVKRFLSNNGFQAAENTDEFSGYYLAYIKKEGLLNGYSVPDEIMNLLNTPVKDGGWWLDYQEPGDMNKLGEFVFTKNSGWMLNIDGRGATSGMSGIQAEDGMTIMIFFTLNYGLEYDGMNFKY